MKTLLTILAFCFSVQINAGVLDDLLASASERIQQQEIDNSNVEVIELLRIESPEELEAELTDGYPMPWLEDILNDESIPEEDRYWLDCRIRAHIARHLHRFYDRNGNPVEIEAEWISPGEHYWQEHMMVNPVGEDYGWDETPDYLPQFTGEPGTIVNLYGEQTGEFALTQRGIIMSRDGTIGVLKTGLADVFHTFLPNYVCFLYSDGSFREIETDFIREWEHVTVSQNGELIVACCKDIESDRPNDYLHAFDEEGNTLYTTQTGGTAASRPAISPDNRYIAIALQSPLPRSIIILDAQTGELLRRFPDLWVREVLFSSDGNWLGHAGNINGIGILDLSPTVDSWEFSSLLSGDSGNYLGMSLCNNPHVVAVSGKVQDRYSIIQRDGVEFYRSEASNLDLSPNRYFGFCFNSRRAYPTDYEPSFLNVVSIRERG